MKSRSETPVYGCHPDTRQDSQTDHTKVTYDTVHLGTRKRGTICDGHCLCRNRQRKKKIKVFIQGAGFEPAKLYAVDLKSTPVDHLGILVRVCRVGFEPTMTLHPSRQ